MKKFNQILVIILSLSLFAGCEKEKQPIPAKVNSLTFLVNGSATTGSHNFFSFAKGAEVSVADSTSVGWDFAMRFEAFLINNTSSGPGNAGVLILSQPFDSVLTAPLSGYKTDTSLAQRAIKPADWYVYNSVTRTFAPIAGRTFVFRTAQSRYAKMEILTADPSDNNGNPVVPPTRPTRIKYSIRIAYQPDGSGNF
jgi:hypothetical protein